MYCIAFFVNDWAFLSEKLSAFFRSVQQEVWLYERGQHTSLATVGGLPRLLGQYAYKNFWFLHGARRHARGSAPPPIFDLYRPKTFAQIDELFGYLGDNYEWTLFPWGGTASHATVAFLSADKELQQRFLSSSVNSLHHVWPDGKTKSYNMLISEQEICKGIEGATQGILFQELILWKERREAGQRVWDVCGCNGLRPHVVYYDSDELDNVFPGLRYGSDLVRVDSLGYPDGRSDEQLAIYQPLTKAAFMSMCGFQHYDPNTLWIFPGTSDLGRVAKLVQVVAGRYKFSDLCYFNEYLQFDWLYVVATGHQDDLYSLFVSVNDRLVGLVADLPVHDHFQLISCF